MKYIQETRALLRPQHLPHPTPTKFPRLLALSEVPPLVPPSRRSPRRRARRRLSCANQTPRPAAAPPCARSARIPARRPRGGTTAHGRSAAAAGPAEADITGRAVSPESSCITGRVWLLHVSFCVTKTRFGPLAACCSFTITI